MIYRKLLFKIVTLVILSVVFIGGGYFIQFLAQDTVGTALIEYHRCPASSSDRGSFDCLDSGAKVEKCTNYELETGKCTEIIGDSYEQVPQQPFYGIGAAFQILGILLFVSVVGIVLYIVIKLISS